MAPALHEMQSEKRAVVPVAGAVFRVPHKTQQLQHSSIGSKSSERCRKPSALCERGSCRGRWRVLGSGEAPLLGCRCSDGQGQEPQLGEVSAARQLQVLNTEKCLL